MGSRWTGRQNDRYGQAAWVTPGHRAPTLVLSRRDDRMVLFGAAKALAAKICTTLASELITSGVTTQPVETVIAVLAASRGGASINAAAKASEINYRTAQRIVGGAAERRQRQLAAVV